MTVPDPSAGAAVSVQEVSKRFRLYRDRRNSLKEAVTRRSGSRYDVFWALRDVSLDVPHGSTYGLIGPNGSGKSTLLKLMAGIHRPTSGTVTARGRVSALLELGAGFHPELSGRDNIYLNGSIIGMSRRQITAAMDEIVDFSGLGDFIDTPVKVYSSGMYVRLGFSIAVNLDPEILLVDEIVAVGDEEFQRRCFDHLAKLRRQGVTIIFVSHSLPLVQDLCDSVAWLDHGRLVATGPALEVVDAYLRHVNSAEQSRLRGAAVDADGTGAGRRGTGEAEICELEYVDATGSPTTVATSGDPMTVRLHYRARETVEDPVFGLAFHTVGGVHIAGPNTKLAGVPTGPISGCGSVDYVFDRLPLLPGDYLVSAAIVDSTLLHVYDYRDRTFGLSVRPGSSAEQSGLVDLPGRWSVPAPARRAEAVR